MPTMMQTPDIFSNIAAKDYLSVLRGKEPDYQAVLNFLNFKKADVAKAVEIPLNCVRWDAKMSPELAERVAEWANLLNLVAGHFGGDTKKTAIWFSTENPMLGNVAPRDMIKVGRYGKLLKFVLNALSGNRS